VDRYGLLPDASNDPEGNCEREWRRSSVERLHAASAAGLAAIGEIRCPDCTTLWPDFHRREPCPCCGLSVDALEDADAFLTHLTKE
jgi:rubrerythrin